MARPPGGSVEQPVVNWRNAFRSSHDIPHRTRTNRRKPGLRGTRMRRPGPDRVRSTRDLARATRTKDRPGPDGVREDLDRVRTGSGWDRPGPDAVHLSDAHLSLV